MLRMGHVRGIVGGLWKVTPVLGTCVLPLLGWFAALRYHQRKEPLSNAVAVKASSVA